MILWLVAYILICFSSEGLYAQADASAEPTEKHIVHAAEKSIYGALTVNSALEQIEKELSQKQITQTAISELAQIISRDPKNCRAYIIMGNCCDYLGLPEQAIQQYRLAFKYGPDKPQACLNFIKALLKTGQWTAANNLLKQAQQRFPDDPQVLLWTGNTSFSEGRYREAESFYLQAMQLAKEPVAGLPTALAQIRLRQENYVGALKLVDQDLAIDGNFPLANEVCGLALMKIGQFERAMPHLKIAFEHGVPSFAVTLDYTQSLIWGGKYNDALIPGLCSLTVANSDEDRAAARKTLNQISIHISKRGIEKAVQGLKQYRLVENSALAHSQMAKLCLDKGLNNLAASESLTAVQRAPQSAEANYELALILETYQHSDLAALQYLRQANAIAPNNYAITQHLMRLEDRLTNHKTDWSWQFKNWIGSSAHQE